ncbi:hypothetical protein NM688_g1557 [Phlebia brevispora]|uniref:Uncharacterized protein n=1 Tax=Phlebia brevispora TaxID=194682 RepID=A0ACC1TAT6_9APHY|nr:hypothetical protein NM688_g1557 [Phlebia brevispora]
MIRVSNKKMAHAVHDTAHPCQHQAQSMQDHSPNPLPAGTTALAGPFRGNDIQPSTYKAWLRLAGVLCAHAFNDRYDQSAQQVTDESATKLMVQHACLVGTDAGIGLAVEHDIEVKRLKWISRIVNEAVGQQKLRIIRRGSGRVHFAFRFDRAAAWQQ